MEPQTVIKHRFFDLVATECMQYLKTNTGMNFKTALDVGCLYGHLVKKLSDSGIDCYGIEKDEDTKPFRITDKIEYREFDENTKLDRKFDLICLTQMIYYVKNPELVLKHCVDLLNTGGGLVIHLYTRSRLAISEGVSTDSRIKDDKTVKITRI